ncbi:MAG: hypothetical protein ACOH2E_08360 [Candidatus Paracaedibacter sp.]
MTNEPMLFEEFYKLKMKDNELNNFAFLFGNGFLRSHPSPNVCKNFELSQNTYKEVLTSTLNKTLAMLSKETTKDPCPETVLNWIRIIYGLEVFLAYQKIHKPLTSWYNIRAQEFVKLFKSIYTLNYDFLSYVNLIDSNKFTDGFCGRKLVSVDEIEKTIKEKPELIPTYYLHVC